VPVMPNSVASVTTEKAMGSDCGGFGGVGGAGGAGGGGGALG